jgi:hypothetical protein
MKPDWSSVRAFAVAVFGAAALFAVAGSLTAQQQIPDEMATPAAERLPVVVLELVQSGGELPPAQRDAVQRAILAIAREAEVVLCLDGRPSIEDPALELLCGQPDRDLPRLWWKARVVTARSGNAEFLRLSLEMGAGPGSPAGPAQLLILSNTPLPPRPTAEVEVSAAAEGSELPLDEEIAASLAAFPDLQDWFGALRQRPGLASPWPSEETASAAPPPPDDEADRPLEPAVMAPEQTETAPAPRKKIEITGQGDTPSKAPAGSASFLVREALVGGGFSQGVTGSLRVSAGGLGFTPRGKSREEWSIPWRNLREASKDAGTWDIPHPLVIVDQKGGKRYIARVDGGGGYLPGDAILSAIRQRRSAGAGERGEESSELP